jgi:hypothetical protein
MSFDTDADLNSVRYITITIPYPLFKYYSEQFCGSGFLNHSVPDPGSYTSDSRKKEGNQCKKHRIPD